MTSVWGKTDPIPAARLLAVSIGKFDGVHHGHRRLLSALRERARGGGLESLAIALDPHPLTVLRPGSAPAAICSLADRCDLLAQLQLDHVKVLEFSLDLSRLTAEEFLGRLASSGMRMLVAGANTRIGRRRAAGIPEIEAICRSLGVTVQTVAIASAGAPFSTGNLREEIAAGNLDAAASISGRRQSLSAVVGSGAGRGAKLGYATANLIPGPGLQLPPDGVYAVSALIENEIKLRPGVANLGMRPTFDGEERLLEVHLFDFADRLLNRRVRVYFEEFLRPEIRFASAGDLVTQIEADCRAARAIRQADSDQYGPWLPPSP